MARRRRLRAACVLVAVLAIASSFRAVEATETAARGGGEDDARDSTTTVRGAGGGARRRLPRETESDDDLLRDDVHDDVRDAAEAEAEANDDDASPRADLPPLIVDADAPALARRDDGDARPRVGLRSRIARIRRAIAAASDATIRDAKMAWSTWTNRVAAALEESGARDAWRKRRWGKLARDLFPEESRVVAAFWRARAWEVAAAVRERVVDGRDRRAAALVSRGVRVDIPVVDVDVRGDRASRRVGVV